MDWVSRPTNVSAYHLEAKYGRDDEGAGGVLSAYEPEQLFSVFVHVRPLPCVYTWQWDSPVSKSSICRARLGGVRAINQHAR